MFVRLKWWMLFLVSASVGVGLLRADEGADCPCIPTHLCKAEPPTQPQEPCAEPGLTRCCTLHDEQQAEMHKAVGEFLTTEQRIMSTIDSIIEDMNYNTQTLTPEDRHREEKSYSTDTNSQNQLIKDEEEFRDDLVNPSNIGDISGNEQHVDLETNVNTDILKQNHSSPLKHTKSDNVFIVYAEKPNKNNAHLNTDKIAPHIVLALQDTLADHKSVTESNQNKAQASVSIESSVTTSNKHGGNQLNIRKPNLHRLFAKHQSLSNSYSLKTQHKNNINSMDDSEVASSDFHEMREGSDIPVKEMLTSRLPGLSSIHVPNISTEQINNIKFRSPPRRLLPRPGTMRSEDNRQMNKNVLELLKEQSKGRMGLKPIRNPGDTSQETKTTSSSDPIKVAIMDTINVRTINSIMKTNFSGQPLDLRKPTPILRNNYQNNLKMGSVLADKIQEQTTENIRISPAVEKEGNKISLHQRGRLRLRMQPINHVSSSVPMSEQDAEKDSSRLQGSLKRLQSHRRLRIRPQVNETSITTQNEMENTHKKENAPQEQFSSTKTLSSFSSRRLRPRMKISSLSSSSKNSSEEAKLTQITNPKTTMTQTLEEGLTDSKYQHDANTSPVKSNSDLESSGSDQQFTIHGRFIPPQQMESGFRPMLNGHNLQIVGPVPRGLSPSSFDTNTDDIGLEPPLPESQIQFGQRIPFNSNRMPPQTFLLPPIFPAPAPPTFQSDVTESEDLALLPPLEEPKPLDSMSKKPKDFTQLHSELDSLKNRYETLLNKYTKALNEYNENFKQFFS